LLYCGTRKRTPAASTILFNKFNTRRLQDGAEASMAAALRQPQVSPDIGPAGSTKLGRSRLNTLSNGIGASIGPKPFRDTPA
jgi:hypothetical protein